MKYCRNKNQVKCTGSAYLGCSMPKHCVCTKGLALSILVLSCACTLSCVKLFVTYGLCSPSGSSVVEFSEQEYWRGVAVYFSRRSLHLGVKLPSAGVFCIDRGGFFTQWATGEARDFLVVRAKGETKISHVFCHSGKKMSISRERQSSGLNIVKDLWFRFHHWALPALSSPRLISECLLHYVKPTINHFLVIVMA